MREIQNERGGVRCRGWVTCLLHKDERVEDNDLREGGQSTLIVAASNDLWEPVKIGLKGTCLEGTVTFRDALRSLTANPEPVWVPAVLHLEPFKSPIPEKDRWRMARAACFPVKASLPAEATIHVVAKEEASEDRVEGPFLDPIELITHLPT